MATSSSTVPAAAGPSSPATPAPTPEPSESSSAPPCSSTSSVVRIEKAGLPDLRFLDYLQRKFSDAVGFLPQTALEDYLGRGFVWLALENDQPAGYLVTRPELRSRRGLASIPQACVCVDAQRRYVGESLVAAYTATLAPSGVFGVQACCAVGLPANDFWLALGFAPICHYRTGNVRNRELICWRKPLVRDLPTWFAQPPKRVGYPPSAPILSRDPRRPPAGHAAALAYVSRSNQRQPE